ncbi:MAG: phosphoribosylanthranilate isomerase [Syntrophorhabdaceae bacterium]|nr:phosphoribosylanthranilate isomerase [Syntrophorhabdaceae bacterium]
MGTRIKICGITNLEDAMVASELGAYAIGFVFYRGSKRYIHPEKAAEISKRLPAFILKVGVFVDSSCEEILEIKKLAMLDRIQVYNEELIEHGLDPSITIIGYRIKDEEDIKKAETSRAFPLLDTYHESLYGGTGISFDWKLLKDFKRPFILAGGIGCDNIKAALCLKPYAIDIASGCESSPGIKDHKKMVKIFKSVYAEERQ